jgi:hypothetical protein
MGVWSLGSVSEFAYNMIANIPSTISGTIMLQIADQQRQFVQDRVGTTIGSNSIDISYQGIIGNLTCAKVSIAMANQALNSSDLKIGDFSVSKSNKVLMDMADRFEKNAMMELERFGVYTPYYKALG